MPTAVVPVSIGTLMFLVGIATFITPCMWHIISYSTVSTFPADGTFIPVGVGVGMLLLLLLVMSIVAVIVVVAVKKKAAHNQKRKMKKMRGNLYHKNTVAKHGGKKVMCADYEDAHDYINADGCGKADDDKKVVYTQKQDATKPHCNTSLRETEGKRSHGCEFEDADIGEEMGSNIDDFSPHENVDSEVNTKHVTVQGPQESSTPASATKTLPVYTVVDKCKKMGAQWKEDNGYTVAFIHQCTIPMMDEMSDRSKGVVASGGVEEREQYEDTVNIRYKTLENQRRT